MEYLYIWLQPDGQCCCGLLIRSPIVEKLVIMTCRWPLTRAWRSNSDCVDRWWLIELGNWIVPCFFVLPTWHGTNKSITPVLNVFTFASRTPQKVNKQLKKKGETKRSQRKYSHPSRNNKMRISTSYVAVLFITVAFRWCCFATVFGGVPIFDENGKSNP